MLKNEMESYIRIGGRDLKNLKYPYMGVGGGGKNCQNHPYVINEWPLILSRINPILRIDSYFFKINFNIAFLDATHGSVDNRSFLVA